MDMYVDEKKLLRTYDLSAFGNPSYVGLSYSAFGKNKNKIK